MSEQSDGTEQRILKCARFLLMEHHDKAEPLLEEEWFQQVVLKELERQSQK